MIKIFYLSIKTKETFKSFKAWKLYSPSMYTKEDFTVSVANNPPWLALYSENINKIVGVKNYRLNVICSRVFKRWNSSLYLNGSSSDGFNGLSNFFVIIFWLRYLLVLKMMLSILSLYYKHENKIITTLCNLLFSE